MSCRCGSGPELGEAWIRAGGERAHDSEADVVVARERGDHGRERPAIGEYVGDE